MKIRNFNIHYLARKLRVFKEEVYKSQSNDVDNYFEFDVERLKQFLMSLVKYKEYAMNQTPIDVPMTAPAEYEIEEVPPILPETCYNEDVYTVIKWLDIMEKEMLGSQSSNYCFGIQASDAKRFDMYIAKVLDFIDVYVAGTAPLDLVETSKFIAK